MQTRGLACNNLLHMLPYQIKHSIRKLSPSYGKKASNYLFILIIHVACMLSAFTTYERILNKSAASCSVMYIKLIELHFKFGNCVNITYKHLPCPSSFAFKGLN